jgi:hypothetical protein
MVLAFIVLLALIVLPLGSYTGSMTAQKTGLSDVETASSKHAPNGMKAAWAQHRRDHFLPVRAHALVYK